jgi:hypothetical protein
VTDLYQTQRAMRNMRRAAMQRGVIAILDVGTSKIACLILRFDGEADCAKADGVGPMAGQSQFRVIGAATTRSARGALWRDHGDERDRTRHPHRRAGGAEDGECARRSRHRLLLGRRAAQLWPCRRDRTGRTAW